MKLNAFSSFTVFQKNLTYKLAIFFLICFLFNSSVVFSSPLENLIKHSTLNEKVCSYLQS